MLCKVEAAFVYVCGRACFVSSLMDIFMFSQKWGEEQTPIFHFRRIVSYRFSDQAVDCEIPGMVTITLFIWLARIHGSDSHSYGIKIM